MRRYSANRLKPVSPAEEPLNAGGFDPGNSSYSAPKLVPYADGPPVLSPWCSDTAAAVTMVTKSRCPFLLVVTRSD